MARRRYASLIARKTSRRVYRGVSRLPKRSVAKILANFAGKVSYKKATSRSRRTRKYRRYKRRY